MRIPSYRGWGFTTKLLKSVLPFDQLKGFICIRKKF